MSTQTSNQWVYVYYTAMTEAWKNPTFKKSLLTDTHQALKSLCNFTPPSNIEIHFVEVTGDDFSALPSFSLSIFDTPQKQKQILKVPLLAAPKQIDNEMSHLLSFSKVITVNCCCVCG